MSVYYCELICIGNLVSDEDDDEFHDAVEDTQVFEVEIPDFQHRWAFPKTLQKFLNKGRAPTGHGKVREI